MCVQAGLCVYVVATNKGNITYIYNVQTLRN